MPAFFNGPVPLYIGIDQPVQVSLIIFQPAQVTVSIVAGKGGGYHKGGMAQQIILHIGFINHLVSGCIKDLMNQAFVGGRILQLSNGDLFQIDPHNFVRLPVTCGKRKGEQHIFLRQTMGLGLNFLRRIRPFF